MQSWCSERLTKTKPHQRTFEIQAINRRARFAEALRRVGHLEIGAAPPAPPRQRDAAQRIGDSDTSPFCVGDDAHIAEGRAVGPGQRQQGREMVGQEDIVGIERGDEVAAGSRETRIARAVAA